MTKLQKSAKVYQGLPRSAKLLISFGVLAGSLCAALYSRNPGTAAESQRSVNINDHIIYKILFYMYTYIYDIYICV